MTAVYISGSSDGQAVLIWSLFFLPDFPISLLYFTPIHYIVYIPYLVHGILATIWWYLLPQICLYKNYGGLWRK